MKRKLRVVIDKTSAAKTKEEAIFHRGVAYCDPIIAEIKRQITADRLTIKGLIEESNMLKDRIETITEHLVSSVAANNACKQELHQLKQKTGQQGHVDIIEAVRKKHAKRY